MFNVLHDVCKYCLFNGAYLLYGLLVLAVSITASIANSQIKNESGAVVGRLPPFPGGELQLPIGPTPPKNFIVTQIVVFLLMLANFSFFHRLVKIGIQCIRTLFLMGDNPTPLRSFWRYFNIYYLVVVLPAAFMPPVLHPQRTPDFHLLAAVVLLICVNALGDLVSVRLTLASFRRFESLSPSNTEAGSSQEAIIKEASYYLAVLRAGARALIVLVAVLACSSVLYGVQVGQLDFEFSWTFVQGAWARILKLSELPYLSYWFRGQIGPFAMGGIPGLFLYGMTTFIPIFILSLLALLWLVLLPFRIAINLPPETSPVGRVVMAEAAVFVLCLLISFGLTLAS
jgi:hypothetical protein